MTSTETITRSSIELHSQRSIPHEESNWQASTEPADIDNIVEASRIADASVPDGGYGWVIVAACSLIAFWFIGTTYSWGVLQDALVQKHLGSASSLSFVGSLATACVAAFAIINGRLIRAVGARKMAFLGITLMAGGQILSGFAQHSIGALFVTAGLTMGYGVSACFMVVSSLPAQYFNKRRGLANGLVYAGGGVGGAVISLSMSAIVESLGTAWTFRLLGLVMLITGLPAAYLIQERAPSRSATFVEWKLLRDPQFVLIFIMGVIATFPLLVPPFFVPLYARSLGLSARVGAGLLAAYNFSSAVGRVLCGFLGDKAGPINSLFIALTTSALSMLAIWPVSTSLAPLIAFVVINGLGNGAFFSIMPTVVSSVFGSARLSVAMGMVVTGWTGGYLMGPPIAGYLLDAYGGESAGLKAYRPAMYYAGTLSLAAAGLVAFVRLSISKSPLKRL